MDTMISMGEVDDKENFCWIGIQSLMKFEDK